MNPSIHRRGFIVSTAITTLILLLAFASHAHAAERIDLNSSWQFTIDPMRVGEKWNWHGKDLPSEDQWTALDVPHCWPSDPRTQHTGAAWYRRKFTVPKEAANRHVRLVFDAVFYRAKVWLNGKLLGEHEGGYTPFEFDITSVAQPGKANTLALEVDNSWSTETIPGARPGPLPRDQVYPWWNYGGIVRDVYLLVSSPIHISQQRVVATPNLADGTAALQVTVWVANPGNKDASVEVCAEIQNERTCKVVGSWRQSPALKTSAAIPARSTTPVQMRVKLERSAVELWDQDHPRLYQLKTELFSGDSHAPPPNDTHAVTFGIRSVEVRKTQLLLNGKPVKMGGGNRHSDHPEFGLIEPKQVIDQDMTLMKNANMELAQIPHYPTAPALLEWADRNGLLIIEETGNTWLTPEQMDSPVMRRLFESQTQEMVKRDWNHPSVIGWSVGNEYDSDTPSGVQWTKDMRTFVRRLDETRLVTFGSDRFNRILIPKYRDKIRKPEDEGSHFVDLISVNLFDNLDGVAKKLDFIHSLWPDKAVFIGQWGDETAGGEQRDPAKTKEYIRGFAALIRERPYVIGVSFWAFADYRSRWPDAGTAADCYRHLGAVTRERKPRPAYAMLREEFSPVVIREVTTTDAAAVAGPLKATARVEARGDFPAYELRDYEVRWLLLDATGATLFQDSKKLELLRPGEKRTVNFQCDAERRRGATAMRVEVVRPTGFVAAERTVEIHK